MEGFDGFLDVVEIKRPGGGQRFWAPSCDHGNPIPHTDLIKAITQAHGSFYEIEREANSLKFVERVGLHAIKPRCTLVFGRSADWDDAERRAYRMLNGGYHSLSVLTYDHVLTRARRMLGLPAAAPARERRPVCAESSADTVVVALPAVRGLVARHQERSGPRDAHTALILRAGARNAESRLQTTGRERRHGPKKPLQTLDKMRTSSARPHRRGSSYE
jgi:hypothetical protein